MPDVNSILLLVVVVGAMALFITGKLRVDLIALCVLIALTVLGLIDPDEALYGFASPATATVAAMFVLSAGEDVSRLIQSRDLIVTNELTELYLRKDRAAIAVFLLLLVVALAALNIVPVMVAALIGAVGMILGRCLTLEEAYHAIEWTKANLRAIPRYPLAP